MVQDRWAARDSPTQRASFWQHERITNFETTIEESRYQDPQDIRRPMSIDKALRECCHIPASQYFVAAVRDDGSMSFFTAPHYPLPSQSISSFFDTAEFKRCLQETGSGSNIPYTQAPSRGNAEAARYQLDMERRGQQMRRFGAPLDAYEEEEGLKIRKRPRAGMYRRDANTGEDDAPIIPITSGKRGIKIGNEPEIWSFYEQRFKNCQQTACKLIAKAWVKAVEPKKQSTHPYTGKDEKAPDWWPKPWGPTREERVRHKEPDHLYKRERVYLLNWILRMIVKPVHQQHPAIQKLNLNVSKLEDITMEALSAFFIDKENPSNAKKKPYLKEIFKIAKQEERFCRDEIDADTEVWVMSDDRFPENCISDNEDFPVKEDEEQETSEFHSSMSPQKDSTPQLIIPHAHQGEPATSGDISGGTFVGDIAVRATQYSQQIMGSEMGSEHSHYVEAPGMAGQTSMHPGGNMQLQEMYPSPHDTSRRSSLFTSPSEYTSPATPSLYQAWPQGSAAPSNPSMYFPTAQTSSHPPFVPSTGVQLAPNQSYIGNPFDGMSRGSQDPNQSNMFRSDHVSQPTYPSYLTSDNPALQNAAVKAETLPRTQLH